MPSYTIADEVIDKDVLRKYFKAAKKTYGLADKSDLDYVLEVALKDKQHFPGINSSECNTQETYIDRWVKGYCDAMNNKPRQRVASPKSACSDPAIEVIVRSTQGYTEAQAKNGVKDHNLFMSAENIQGNLLEEYIALRIRPYGFIWCAGNVLRAIDFCNTDGSLLLQIKNKSNTENSSSSSIREGTSIQKWYRLGTRIQNHIRVPDYKWSSLNVLVNTHKTEGKELPPCNMTEADYEAFLSRAAAVNHNLITSL